jgi:uncharacterized protein
VSRTYRDPIHQEINLNSEDPVENLLIQLIDCRELQRLRWIRQLGTSWYTFHGAEASRFQHSLGAMHVARLILEKLFRDLSLTPEEVLEYRSIVLSAALLHDIGHGPFSHSCEKIMKTKHEEWTKKLIQSPETQINKVLNEFDPELSSKVISLLGKTHPVKFLCNVVSSQLDCDRFDYLLRDSYYTGTSYGNFDLQRVISSLTVNKEHDCLVVAGDKGMLAVEDYLYARYSMYLQVYQHKKSLATEILLQKLFKRLKLLSNGRRVAFLENALHSWITAPDRLSVKDFLMIDDTYIIHHIKHWIEEKDIVLRDLSKRFIERKLFRAVKIQIGEDLPKLLEEKSQELRKMNLDPDYYLDTVTIASNPYSFYNPDKSDFFKAIFVQNQGQLQEISEISHVVASLVKNDFQNTWLISV